MAYIDKENLIKELEKHFDILRGEDGRLLYSDHICTGEDVDDLLELVKALPTADVVEVKRGEWICVYDSQYGETKVTCSVCEDDRYINGCYVGLDDEPLYDEDNYCPNCGADMRGGKNDL